MNTPTENFELLKKNKFFRGLNDSQLLKVLALSQEVNFKKSDSIIQEGDVPDVFYVIKKGEIEISKKDPDKNVSFRLGTLKEGAVVGEVGFVTQKKRNASIIALTDVAAITFTIKAFHDEAYSDIFLLLTRNMSEDLVSRLDDSYNLVVGTMHTELKKSRKLRFYQFITIIIMTFFLIESGLTIRYIWDSSGLCKDVKSVEQATIPHGNIGI